MEQPLRSAGIPGSGSKINIYENIYRKFEASFRGCFFMEQTFDNIMIIIHPDQKANPNDVIRDAVQYSHLQRIPVGFNLQGASLKANPVQFPHQLDKEIDRLQGLFDDKARLLNQ